MNPVERRRADRRADALAVWRGLERRQEKRRALVSARQAHWFNRFQSARSEMATGNIGE